MATIPIPVMPLMKHSIDLKANGEVSRMRNHKGNMPSLPQTKYCSLCPAKFTRTTHLNRHLRSHTNERSHRCNTCHAEFTRSDLLTRHKRTCGDSNANRSRRKSCQACAESKVKCNLQYPCSKCASRGRECIFINDPETSRNKKNAAKKAAQRSSSVKSSDSISTGLGSVLLTDNSTIYPSLYNTNLSSPTLSLNSVLSTTSRQTTVPSLSNSSTSSSPSSSRGSPRSDLFDSRQDLTTTFDQTFDGLALDTNFNRLFASNMFETFLDEPITSCSPQVTNPGDFATWMEGNELSYPSEDPLSFPQGFSLDSQDFNAAEYPILPLANDCATPGTLSQQFSMPPGMDPTSCFDPALLMDNNEPTVEELNQYLYLFFSTFCVQVPLIHHTNWQTEGKSPLLLRAMQACGALFAKTKSSLQFINDTLTSTRDLLITEYSKPTSDLGEQVHLILTVVLLETIGLFHQQPDQRTSSSVYHNMLVMMIRRIGLINRVGSWALPDLNDVNALDNAWKDWAHYETIKRALFLSYLHDCCHCMYFSLSPSFHPTEFDISLPCDDALWLAGNARQWLQILQAPSPYGTGIARISGVGMPQALAVLGEMRPSGITLPLNPFAHFVLIHTILRNIYASRSQTASSLAAAGVEGDPRILANGHRPADSAAAGFNAKENTFAIQYALHNWLQLWMNSPETMQLEKSGEEPPFVYNAMPFYWLAQVAVVAIQDGAADGGSSVNARLLDDKGEGRYRLLKEWLDRIRTFLRNGTQIPTHLWDELMKIRLQVSQCAAGQYVDEAHHGILDFFPSG